MPLTTARTLRVMLPPRSVLAQRALAGLDAMLARGDQLVRGERGREAALARAFADVRLELAAGPLSRLFDVGDAGEGMWLRADPCHARVDPNGLRLIQVGGFDLTAEERGALERALKPLCGDLGFEFSAPTAERWYLRSLHGAPLPRLPRPEDILGDDLYLHLPSGAPGAKWRQLHNEIQMLLHQMPFNSVRSQHGLPSLNTLWLWGGGALPRAQPIGYAALVADEVVLRAVARLAQCELGDRNDDTLVAGFGAALIECWLPQAQDWFARALLPQVADAWRRGLLAEVLFDFADGEVVRLLPRHRWRFWRRAAKATV